MPDMCLVHIIVLTTLSSQAIKYRGIFSFSSHLWVQYIGSSYNAKTDASLCANNVTLHFMSKRGLQEQLNGRASYCQRKEAGHLAGTYCHFGILKLEVDGSGYQIQQLTEL